VTAAVRRGNVTGTQFHPEKSGPAGLSIIKAFLEGSAAL
jgi:imidazoleglycerol phosphate synthase glutamine amidotransferase subunit HisH